MEKRWKVFLGVFVLACFSLGFFLKERLGEENLQIINCDVGQGDGAIIQKGSIQVIVDGGPTRDGMVECLERHVPFWDRKLELVVLTHPDWDHYRGLLKVFENFEVEAFLASAKNNESEEYQALIGEIEERGIEVISPDEGKRLSMGDLYFDIVYPSSEDLEGEKVLGAFDGGEDQNAYSVVFVLRYGDFDGLFTGDIGPSVSDRLAEGGELGDVEYLKVPHHGSRNGLTEKLLERVTSEVSVISVGKNQWGHPHEEVLEMLEERGGVVLRTDKEGDIELQTDGKRYWVE